MKNRNPQASQMASESMIRTLEAQVRCIWPQESELFARYGTPNRILDLGCGTGVFTAELAKKYPNAFVMGIDINNDHVQRAQKRCLSFGNRVQIEQGDAYSLEQSLKEYQQEMYIVN